MVCLSYKLTHEYETDIQIHPDDKFVSIIQEEPYTGQHSVSFSVDRLPLIIEKLQIALSYLNKIDE